MLYYLNRFKGKNDRNTISRKDMKDEKLVQVQKKFYSEPKIQNIGRMIVHTNGTTSRTNDPGGSVGGEANVNAGPKK